MGTMTIRLPDDTHERLKLLAEARGVSLNKMFEEFSARAIAEADSYARFSARTARGSAGRGMGTLDRLDRHYKR